MSDSLSITQTNLPLLNQSFAPRLADRVPIRSVQRISSAGLALALGRRVTMPPADSSVELLSRASAGDRTALDELLRRYVPALRRWARGRLPRWARDMSETEDLVQDTVLRSLQNLHAFEYRHDGALQAYLRQAVMNRIRDECRRVTRRPGIDAIDDAMPDSGVSPLEAAIGVEATERYEAALQRLREEDQQAIVGRIEMGYGYVELALMLGKPSPNAARVAVSRALIRLAEAMRHGG